MRTISSAAGKGKEPVRTLLDDVRLLRHILRMAFTYFVRGRSLRREFLRRQRLQQRLFVEDVELP